MNARQVGRGVVKPKSRGSPILMGLVCVILYLLFKDYLKPPASTAHQGKHTYKLSYFDGRGAAEVCRLVFAAANVSYPNRVSL